MNKEGEGVKIRNFERTYFLNAPHVKSLSVFMKIAQGFRVMIILTEDFSENQSSPQPLFFERVLYIQIYNTLVDIKA